MSVNESKEILAGSNSAGLRICQPMKIAEQTWPEGTDPVVSICCATYNHAAFIRDCIDGFLAQRTTFPIEILINDDASTDRNAEIIRDYTAQYPHLIKPIFQTQNQLSKGLKPNPNFNFPRVNGEYIAFCEGDDYWTDPLKLEKQVQFLQTHTDYSLCWTRFKTRNEKTGEFIEDNNGLYFSGPEGSEFDFEIFQQAWHIGMQTLLFRAKPLLENNHFSNPYYKDVFLISDLLNIGKGFCLNEFTAIYRLHDGGIYSSTNPMSRAEIGAATYREIFQAYPGNVYLKKKYENFSNNLIKLLIGQGAVAYPKALQLLNEQLRLTTQSEQEKNDFLFEKITKLLVERDESIHRLTREAKSLTNELRNVYRSASFRTGRALTAPVRALHKIKNNAGTLSRKISRALRSHAQIESDKHKQTLLERGVIFIDKKKLLKESKHLTPMPSTNAGNPKLVVSLTSFPPRVDDLFFTIYSLLIQSYKPDLLVLWLADSQFPRREKDLPTRLLKLRQYGLTIKWCHDIRSYKKLIPALKEYPEAVIVTADDDIYYPQNWLSLLVDSYKKEPSNIHCQRAHRIVLNSDGTISPYINWINCISSAEASFLNFPTGGGGTLYPPKSLFEDVSNEELFMKLCPTADDIWFWAMALMNNRRIRVIDKNISKDELTYLDPIEAHGLKVGHGLWAVNEYANDGQLESVISYYKDRFQIINKLKEEMDGAIDGRA